MRRHMYRTRLVIGGFLKTVNLVLIDDTDCINHVTIETTGGEVKKRYVPIIDSDAVLG